MSDYTCAASDFYNQLEQHTQLLAVHMIGAQAGAHRNCWPAAGTPTGMRIAACMCCPWLRGYSARLVSCRSRNLIQKRRGRCSDFSLAAAHQPLASGCQKALVTANVSRCQRRRRRRSCECSYGIDHESIRRVKGLAHIVLDHKSHQTSVDPRAPPPETRENMSACCE